MDMTFGTWNVRSLYRAGSLETVASELAKHNLNLVAVQEVRWVEDGSQPAEDYTFFHRDLNVNNHLGKDPFIHKEIISAVERVEFISD
jgi:exonuclease III